jgi:hypothetical protein
MNGHLVNGLELSSHVRKRILRAIVNGWHAVVIVP